MRFSPKNGFMETCATKFVILKLFRARDIYNIVYLTVQEYSSFQKKYMY